ncbi:MAG: esterase/lipase family protein [Anaerolineales bacterium]
MLRVLHKLLATCLLLVLSFGLPAPAHSQSTDVLITLLDKLGQPTTSLTDGDTLSLKIELVDPLTRATQVDFLLSGFDTPIANCRIMTIGRSCETASFSALGWYWNPDGTPAPQRTISARLNSQQAEGAALSESKGNLNVTIFPRPVVMVHGFNADFHTWDNYLGPNGYLASLGLQGFAVGDGQVEGVMNAGSLSDPTARTNTIAENANILGEYIGNVQALTGAEKVDLLVHSMGGMISRYYLDRVMTRDNVAQLIILGTPMAGSACANLPAALGVLLPATLEIQPGYMNDVFNPQIVHRRGVPFHALAGTKLVDAVESPCTPVPSDLVVTVDSVRAIPMPVQEIDLLHMDLNTSPRVFDEFVKPLLQTPSGAFEVAEDLPARPASAVSQQFTKVYTGHLNPGETQDVVINIDANVSVANFALYDTSRSLDVSVAGASGNTIELTAEKNGLIKVDDPSTLVYLGYGFKQPKPGKWVVTLLTTDATPATGADYAIMAVFDGGATLTAQADKTVPALNEPVHVSADLTVDGGPVPIQSAQAVLRRPDGSAETLNMIVTENSASLEITPKTSGIYGIEVNVSAQAADSMPIDRAAFLNFEVQSPPEQIARTRLIVGLLVIALLAAVIIVLRMRKGRMGKISESGLPE